MKRQVVTRWFDFGVRTPRALCMPLPCGEFSSLEPHLGGKARQLLDLVQYFGLVLKLETLNNPENQ